VTRRFTGRHMMLLMVAFFGVVVLVNLLMAHLALGTFGGTVVDNSYVASQRYNTWLAAGREQAKLGWTTKLDRDADGHVVLKATTGSDPLTGASISGVAHPPLGRKADISLVFEETGAGTYRVRQPLPEGRWQVHILFARDGRQMRVLGDVG